MKQVTFWFILFFAGIGMAACSTFFTGIPAGMFSMMGAIVAGVPLFLVLGPMNKYGLATFWNGLKGKERFCLVVSETGKCLFDIMKVPFNGLLEKNNIGIVMDTADRMSFGNLPFSICVHKMGTTASPKVARYWNSIKENLGIESAIQALEHFVGPGNYDELHRRWEDPHLNPKKIKANLNWLIDMEPKDDLAQRINGETVDFKDLVRYELVRTDPVVLHTGIDNFRSTARLEAMKMIKEEGQKISAIGKTVVLICIGLGILLIILSSVDLGGIMGGIFGG